MQSRDVFMDAVHGGGTKTRGERILGQIQAVAWLLLAAGIAYYGNGRADLVTLLLYSRRLNRPFVLLAGASIAVNAAVFLYVYAWLARVRRVDVDRQAQWAIPVGAGSFAVAFVSLIIALWPIFSVLAIPIIIIQSIGFVVFLQLVPTFGIVRAPLKQD